MSMWLFLGLCGVVAIVMVAKRVQQKRIVWCHSTNRLEGKLVIVTGASAGLGLETALDMARRGARVIMACRNLDKAQKVADEIIEETGNKEVVVKQLDLASLASVRTFANNILRTKCAINILINNAGCVPPLRKVVTEDGLELTMQANHFGHFLLTNMLGGLLKEGAPSRILCVASDAHEHARIDPDDLCFRTTRYFALSAYRLSKLCNVLTVKELANRLKGTGVTAYAVHPGFVATEIMSKHNNLIYQIMDKHFKLFAKDVKAGAQTTIYCAVDDAVAGDSGLYYVDCQEAPASALGRSAGLAGKLWRASELAVNLKPHEAKL